MTFPTIKSLKAVILAIVLTNASAADKPNILFILCDDLGYGDIGVFYQNEKTGPSFKTPHIDKLAEDGIQLRAHYAPAPVCAPSRASLLLGQHQGNCPIRNNQFDKALPEQVNLASVLKEAGYHTGLIGKYGLQGKGENAKSWPAYPTKRGFDYFLGAVRHRDGHEHYPHDRIHSKEQTEIWENDNEISNSLKGCYTTDLFTAAAKKFLSNHKAKSPRAPFFLFLSYDTPHAATQIASSPYPKGFGLTGGIQWQGKSGAFINTANRKPDSYIHPDYAGKSWPDVSKRYASSIRRIDNSVADIRQTLEDLGYAQNTLIVFTSDHGPSKESYISEQLRPDFFESFGPFTGIKRDCWEGGLRPGAIAVWPARIPPKQISESPSQMHDWMPTICEVAGTPVPAIADGTSLIPTLTSTGEQGKSIIYTEYQAGRATPDYKQFPKPRRRAKRGEMQAIRQGDLKAIRYNIKSPKSKFMVFNVVKDPREKNNLAGKKNVPDQAYWRELASRLHGHNRSAKRPYDSFPMMGLNTKRELSSGLKAEKAKGRSSYISRQDATLKGYLKIEKSGTYLIKAPDSIIRIHHVSLNGTPIALGKGLHPIEIYSKTPLNFANLSWATAKDPALTPIPRANLYQ